MRLFEVDTTEIRSKRIREPLINAYRFQVLNGLRPGELLGLRWGDVKDDILHIRRSINIYGEETTGKNDNAIRPLALNQLSRQILTEQWHQYPGGPEDAIFGEVSEVYYRNRWERFCRFNGISYVSPYELRHTFVSLAKNLSEGQIKRLVGHSANMDTFGTYGHEVKGELTQTAEELNRLFARVLGVPTKKN